MLRISFWRLWETFIFLGLAVILTLVFLFQTASHFVATSSYYQNRLLQQLHASLGLQAKEVKLAWSSAGPFIGLQNAQWQARDGSSTLEAREIKGYYNPLAHFWASPPFYLVIADGVITTTSLTPDSARTALLPANRHFLGELHNLSFETEAIEGESVTVQNGLIKAQDGKLSLKANGLFHWQDRIDAELRVVWNAQQGLYLNLKRIDLRPNWHTLIGDLPLAQEIASQAGKIDTLHGQAKIWLRPEAGKIGRQLSADVNIQQLGPSSTALPNLKDLSFTAQLDYAPNNNNWSSSINDLQVELEDKKIWLPATHIRQSGAIYVARTARADMGQLMHALKKLTPNASRRNEILSSIDPQGTIYDMELRINGDNASEWGFTFDSWLANVSLQPSGPTPGGYGISGYISIKDNRGQLLLDAQESGVFIAQIYPRPLPFHQGRGQFAWEFVPPDQLLIVGSASDIRNEEQNASMELGIHSIFQKHGYVDLQVGLKDASMDQAKIHIPWLVLGNSTRNWLNRSLVDGDVQQAALSLKIDTRNPQSMQNIFELTINAEDAVFNYDDNQEPLTARAANVLLDGNHLDVQLPRGAEAAKSMRATAMQAQVDTDTGLLSMEGKGDIQGSFLASLMNQYMLNSDSAESEDLVAMNGTLNGDWGFVFDIPRRNLNGLFFDAQLNLSALHHPLLIPSPQNLHGHLGFSEQQGYHGNFSGNYDGSPLDGRFITQDDSNYLQLDLSLTPANYVPPSLAPYIHGKGPAQVRLYRAKKKKWGFDGLSVTSDLLGVGINLPSPLAKTKRARAPANLDLAWEGDERTVRLNMQETVSAGLRSRAGVPKGWNVQMPASKLKLIQEGLMVDIQTPVNLTAWRNLLWPANNQVLRIADAVDTLQTLQTDYPSWQIEAESAEFAGRLYRNVIISYRQDEPIHFALGKTSGQMEFVNDKLNIHLAELNIKKSDRQKPHRYPRLPRLSFAGMPPIKLAIDKLAYDDEAIGGTVINTTFAANKMVAQIDTGQLLNMPASGDLRWDLPRPGQSRIQTSLTVNGDLPSGTVPNMAADDLAFSIRLDWQGENNNFDQWQQQAQGEIKLKVKDGEIVTSRNNLITNLISFLNINNLAGRLTGNFKDVSGTHMVFNDLSVGLKLEDGNLTTAPALNADFTFGHLGLAGDYELKTQQYDFRATVTPAVSQTLPLTALLLGVPAALPVLLAVEIAGGGQFINRLGRVDYHILGNATHSEVKLVRLGDASGAEVDPEELPSKTDVKNPLQDPPP